MVFLKFSGCRLRLFKDGGRQYKCHNISKPNSHRAVMLMTLDSLMNSDLQQCTPVHRRYL